MYQILFLTVLHSIFSRHQLHHDFVLGTEIGCFPTLFYHFMFQSLSLFNIVLFVFLIACLFIKYKRVINL